MKVQDDGQAHVRTTLHIAILAALSYDSSSVASWNVQLMYQGFAFSVRKGIRVPPSLRNIYKELADEIPGFTIPKHGYVLLTRLLITTMRSTTPYSSLSPLSLDIFNLLELCGIRADFDLGI